MSGVSGLEASVHGLDVPGSSGAGAGLAAPIGGCGALLLFLFAAHLKFNVDERRFRDSHSRNSLGSSRSISAMRRSCSAGHSVGNSQSAPPSSAGNSMSGARGRRGGDFAEKIGRGGGSQGEGEGGEGRCFRLYCEQRGERHVSSNGDWCRGTRV